MIINGPFCGEGLVMVEQNQSGSSMFSIMWEFLKPSYLFVALYNSDYEEQYNLTINSS